MTTALMRAPLDALESWGTLLGVGAQALLRVLRLEQPLLQLALERQRVLERHLGPGDDAALDEADRLARLVRRAEPPGVLEDLLPEAVRLEDVRHQAEGESLLERERAPGRHQLERPRPAEQPRQTLRAARAGEDAQRDLRQADRPGPLPGDADVRRHRHLQPAADG